jgi:elongation factor Ts
MYMSTAKLQPRIIKLRQTTGAGLMDCRKALVESDGILKNNRLSAQRPEVAACRSDRETKEGVIIAKTHQITKLV